MPRPLVVDCDTGVDDALALLWLASQTAELEMVGVGSVHGNIDAARAARNTLAVLEVAGLGDVPVALGARRPMVQELHLSGDVHGSDGLGNSNLAPPRATAVEGSAAEQLVRLARRHAGGLVVLSTGPLTNLALALLLEPDLPAMVEQLVVMGGAVGVAGNITPFAEANIWHDPEAAALVLSAGFALRLVGLDVTTKVRLGQAELEVLASSGPRGALAAAVLPHYMSFYEPFLGERASLMHDPLAAVLTVSPALASYRPLAVSVELAGLSRGATLVDWRAGPPPPPPHPPVDVALEVDSTAALAVFMDGMRP